MVDSNIACLESLGEDITEYNNIEKEYYCLSLFCLIRGKIRHLWASYCVSFHELSYFLSYYAVKPQGHVTLATFLHPQTFSGASDCGSNSEERVKSGSVSSPRSFPGFLLQLPSLHRKRSRVPAIHVRPKKRPRWSVGVVSRHQPGFYPAEKELQREPKITTRIISWTLAI